MPLIASMQNNSRLELKSDEIREGTVTRHVDWTKEYLNMDPDYTKEQGSLGE